MKAEKMTPEEIVKFNAKVEYNHCVISWIIDIICIIIATPMIWVAIHRRIKYRKKIELCN